jgi:hypothetical protein
VVTLQAPVVSAQELERPLLVDYDYKFIPDPNYAVTDDEALLEIQNWGYDFARQYVKWLDPDGHVVSCGGFCAVNFDYAPNGAIISSEWEFNIAEKNRAPGTYTAVVYSCTALMGDPCQALYELFRAQFTIGGEGYSITGNAGTGSVVLSYLDGTVKTVTADGDGDYAIFVPTGWSGTVTPYLAGKMFIPANRAYTSLAADQTAQDYTAADARYIMIPLVIRE